MRKFLTIAMLFLTVTTYAEKVAAEENQVNGKRYYVQVNAGAHYDISEFVREYSFGDKIGPDMSFNFGMEFNPYWSADVLLGYNRNARYDIAGVHGFNSVDFFVNAAYNLSNGIGGLQPERKHQFYVYAGVGAAHSHISQLSFNKLNLGVRAGLTYTYAFSPSIAGVADLGMNLYGDNFNGNAGRFFLDGSIHAKVGLRVYL